MQFPVTKGVAALSVLTVSLIIAGCASTGGIAPEASSTDPASLDAGAAIRAANTDAHWPAADWWRAYNDPQLNAWIEQAQAGSPSLAAAEARVREAKSIAGVAKSALAPQVNGSMQVQREHWPDNVFYGPGPLANQDTWNNTATIGLSYHLDLWGKDKNAAERALDVAHARAADARAAQLELEANVVRTYIGMSMNYALLDIAKSTLDQQQQVADLAHRRLNGGLGTQLEVSQSETPLPEYERQIDALEESIALARNQLAALAGKGPGAGDSITRPQLSLTANGGLPSTLPAELIGHRPDIVAARWLVAAQARGIDVAKAEFYPDVDLLASIGGYAAAGPLFQFLKSPSQSWTGGPALSLPIFTGGRLRSQLGEAAAGYDEAVDQYNQTIVGALKEIADQVVRMRSLDTQLKDSQRSVDIATRNYQLAREGYRRGLTDYVNVLIAQTALLRAQEGIAKVSAERLSAHATLLTALGGGVIDPADGPSQKEVLPAHGKGRKPANPAPNAPIASGSEPASARYKAGAAQQPVVSAATNAAAAH